MSQFALVTADGVVLRFEEHDERPTAHKDKPQWLPVIDPGFDPVSQVQLGYDVDPGGVAVIRAVRDKTTEEVAAMRVEKLAEIKAEAERRILAVMPEWKQRNFMALGVELVTTYGANPASWPAEKQAIYGATMGKWAQIKLIRARSDELEAAVPEDAAGIAAVDATQGWD